MDYASDLVSTRVKRRARLSFIDITGSQAACSLTLTGNFLKRVILRGEMSIDRYTITDEGLKFVETLTIPIPYKHLCHVRPKNPYGGSLGTLVRYWDRGTYTTQFDECEDTYLVLTKMHFYFW